MMKKPDYTLILGKTISPPIPVSPSKEDAFKALKILLKLLKDFSFENDESKSVVFLEF